MTKSSCREPVRIVPYQILNTPVPEYIKAKAIVDEIQSHLDLHFGLSQDFTTGSRGVCLPKQGVRFSIVEPTGVLYVKEESSLDDSGTILHPGHYEVLAVRKEGKESVGVIYWLNLIKMDTPEEPKHFLVKAAMQTFDGYIRCIDWRGIRNPSG